tara:strand:+ start:1597 stop:1803 length:207 start_codon:yes stop_codon:yes gene_type:complete
MKVKVKNQKKEFQPIEMKIVFETQAEINDLYNRVNISLAQIKLLTGEEYRNSIEQSSWVIFEQLKKLI